MLLRQAFTTNSQHFFKNIRRVKVSHISLHRVKRTALLNARGHQPLWNWGLLIGYQLTRRAINLINNSEQNFAQFAFMLLLMILIYMKILITLMLFSKQARVRRTWSSRATWCPRAPCWWPLLYTFLRVLEKNWQKASANSSLVALFKTPWQPWCPPKVSHTSRLAITAPQFGQYHAMYQSRSPAVTQDTSCEPINAKGY